MQDEAEVKPPVRSDGLQLEENRTFQRWFWMAERIGWAGFAVVIALALSGVTGRGGWLAVAEHRSGAALVEVPRVARRGESTVLRVHFGRTGGRHLLAVGADLLAHFDMLEVTPRPVRSVAAGGGLALQFESAGPPPHGVRLHLRARRAGIAEARIVADGAGVTVRSLILP